MDIPQQPKSITASPTIATSTRLPEQPPNPVSVEALNLDKDKIYQAIVSKLIDNKVPTTPDQPQNPNATDKGTSTSNEWLLKLNGKLLLITSEKPLQLGQSLQVQLNTTTQTLTVLPSSTSQSSPIPPPNSSFLSNTSITLLLSAINQVMPRQVSLDTGLTALETFSKQNDSQLVSNQAKLILLMLAKQAPTEQLFTTTEKTSSTTAIVNFLKDSGIFFESGAKQQPSNPNSLKAQISQIQEAFNLKQITIPPNTSQTTPAAGLTDTFQNSRLETNKSNASPIDFNSIRNALLTKLQIPLPATPLEATLNLPTSTTTNTSTPSTLSPLHALLNSITSSINSTHTIESSNIQNDLKGLLLSITAALITDKTGLKASERSPVEALVQLDLLKNPFNFPHFIHQPATLASSKAEALLADQQFTTGQLLKLIAGMLNRIQFNQLNSLYQSHGNSNDTTTTQSWFFELPVANPNNQLSTFDVRIDREEDTQEQEQEQNNDQKEVQWKLALSFKFEQLGAVYVQVTLAPPAISSIIWADKPETLSLINREKPYFQSKLSELGLEVGDIFCQKGQPKQDKTRLDRSLVDIKA
jgi:hypothetical protein